MAHNKVFPPALWEKFSFWLRSFVGWEMTFMRREIWFNRPEKSSTISSSLLKNSPSVILRHGMIAKRREMIFLSTADMKISRTSRQSQTHCRRGQEKNFRKNDIEGGQERLEKLFHACIFHQPRSSTSFFLKSRQGNSSAPLKANFQFSLFCLHPINGFS